jgi:hypothetical protein
MATIFRTITAATWAGLALGTQTAANLNIGSLSGTWTLAESAGQRVLRPPASSGVMRFTPFAGGAADPMAGGATLATQSVRVRFVADLATYATANDTELLRFTLGTGARYVTWRTVRRDGNHHGVRLWINTASLTDGNQSLNINDVNAGVPVLEYNRWYDLSIVLENTSTGQLALYIDGRFAGRVTGNIAAELATGNHFNNWGWFPYNSGAVTGVTVEFAAAMLHTQGTRWKADHFPTSPTAERPDPLTDGIAAHFPRVFNCEGPIDLGAADGADFGVQQVAGSGTTLAFTEIATAGLVAGQRRAVISGTAGDALRFYTADGRGNAAQLGNVPEQDGWRWVVWPKQYDPSNGSASYAVYPAGTHADDLPTATPLLAVRLGASSSGAGIIAEGLSGQGRRLGAWRGGSRYTLALGWNAKTGHTRVALVDLTSAQPGNGQGAGSGYAVDLDGNPLLQVHDLDADMTGVKVVGPAASVHTLGGTSGEGPCGVWAGAGAATLVMGDSYGADQANSVSPVCFVARNNVCARISNGVQAQLLPRGYRDTRMADLTQPGADLVVSTTIARSGGRAEDIVEALRPHLSRLAGWNVIIPGYAYNSLTGIDAATRDTVLARIAGVLATLIGDLADGGARVWWMTPPSSGAASTNFVAAGAALALRALPARVTDLLRARAAGTINGTVVRSAAATAGGGGGVAGSLLSRVYVANTADMEARWFVGSGDNIHPGGAGNADVCAACWPGPVQGAAARSAFRALG